MPYLIDGRSDGVNIDIPLEQVVLRDHEALSLTPIQQFGFHEDNRHELLRAEFEVGRVFWHLKRPRKTLPPRLRGSKWICDRFKRALEEMEPGKHRFVPLDLRHPDKVRPWPEPYWFWRCENFVDAVIPDIGDGDSRRSSRIRWNAEKGYLTDEKCRLFSSGALPVPLEQPVLNRSAIAHVHAWRDSGFAFKHSIGLIFLSDALVERLSQKKAVGGLSLRPIDVSDLPAIRIKIGEGR